MTIVVGLKHDGHVYMGADRVTSTTSGNKGIMAGSKLWRSENGRLLFGFAGSPRFMQLVQYQAYFPHDCPVNDRDPMAYMVHGVVEAIRRVTRDYGYLQSDRNQDTVDSQALIAYKGRLFVIYSDLQVYERIDDYEAIGSGSWYALGSLYTTAEMGLPPEKRVEFALRAAGYHHTGCGAPYEIHVLHPAECACEEAPGEA